MSRLFRKNLFPFLQYRDLKKYKFEGSCIFQKILDILDRVT